MRRSAESQSRGKVVGESSAGIGFRTGNPRKPVPGPAGGSYKKNFMAEELPQFADIAVRLRGIREAFSGDMVLTKAQWAAKHGFGVTQYHNWEKGIRRIPLDDAEFLCDLYGLTLDWIYRNRRDCLSATASKRL